MHIALPYTLSFCSIVEPI